MRLLFDENLSPDLPQLLAGSFPDSVHVRVLGIVGADDAVVWAAAAQQGLVLVTKDDDFRELSILRGAPPKVVVTRLGKLPDVRRCRFARRRETQARAV